MEALKERLNNRGDTSAQQIQMRLDRARWEMEQAARYDYQVINDQVDTCADKILKIIAEKTK